jgi:uncharacterized protein (DUF2236 family)
MADPRRWAAWLCTELAGGEDVGYFGPGSALWQLNREAVLGLGLGRAVLMQLAHPWVAQAVADHSPARDRPLERLLTTATAAELLVFGSRRQADEAAARIRQVHARVSGVLAEDVGRWARGTPYRADDPDALLWVLVTVVDTALVLYEAIFGRLPEATLTRYLAEAAHLGSLVGLPREALPRDRSDLARYLRTVLSDGTIAVGSVARHLAGALARPHFRAGTDPFFRVYSWLTLGLAEVLLPEVLREQYAGVLPRRQGGPSSAACPSRHAPIRWPRTLFAAVPANPLVPSPTACRPTGPAGCAATRLCAPSQAIKLPVTVPDARSRSSPARIVRGRQ